MYEVIYQVSFNLSDMKYLALVFLLKHEEDYVGKLCLKQDPVSEGLFLPVAVHKVYTSALRARMSKNWHIELACFCTGE